MNYSQGLMGIVLAHIFARYVKEMPKGKRLSITSIDSSAAFLLTEGLRRLVVDNLEDAIAGEFAIAVVEAKQVDEDLRISVHKATELRNRKERILYFLPDSVSAQNVSFGDSTFDTRSMLEIYAEIASEHKQTISDLDGGSELLRQLQASLPAQTSVHSIADLLTLISGDLQSLGENLWRVGLIPDLGKDVVSRLQANARVVSNLTGRAKPLSGTLERLASAGLNEGAFRDELQKSLQPFPVDFQNWLRQLPKSQTFENWPFSAADVLTVDQLTVEPFVKSDGKVDARCKLKRDEYSGSLVAENKVSVYWVTRPANVSTIARWEIELTPPEAIQTDFPALTTMSVASDKRMATISFELNEDELESLAPRYVVRITALDEAGQALHLADGSMASVESQEFIVSDGGEIATSRVVNANSIPEALLQKVLDGKSEINETGPTWDLAGQVFSLSLTAFDKAQIQISSFIIDAQKSIFLSPKDAYWHYVDSPSGSEVGFGDAKKVELDLPSALKEKRRKLFDLVANQESGRNSMETVIWDDELRLVVDQYVAAYKRALESCRDQSQLIDLLLLETVTVNTHTAQGIVAGVVLLPTHPLRAAWLAKHDEKLRSWVGMLKKLKKSARRGQVDEQLVGKISPANLPFLLLGGTSKQNLETFSYTEELTHGSALYLGAGSVDQNTEAQYVREALRIQGTPKSVDSAGDLLSERMYRYRVSHPGAPGIRTLLVNSANGQIPADASRRLVAKLGEQASGLRLEFVGYGAVTSYANPLSKLMAFQREYEESSAAVMQNHLAPNFGLVSRPLSDLLSDTTRANLAIVQSFTALSPGPVKTTSSLSSSLEGLLTPTSSFKSSSQGQSKYYTQPALQSNNSKGQSIITEAHSSFLEGLSRALFDDDVPMGLSIQIDDQALARLAAAHRRSDWVLTLDRNIGLAVYEDLVGKAFGNAYVLDYAPDFIDGIGDRLTVTTTRQDELEVVLAKAMDKLGMLNRQEGAEELLRALASVSGRLALKLLGEDTGAVEALGLAATVKHLDGLGALKNAVLIPVDAHHELFGAKARDSEMSGERCDLLIVTFKKNSYTIEFLEVKARSGHIEKGLESHMSLQIEQTLSVLKNRLFGNQVPRIDNEVQWARWASLLHFYAERGALHGLIEASELAPIHKAIDRIEMNNEKPIIKRTGYIVSLQGKESEFAKSHNDMEIRLLNAQKMEDMGFTTKFSWDESDIDFAEGSDEVLTEIEEEKAAEATFLPGDHERVTGDGQDSPEEANTSARDNQETSPATLEIEITLGSRVM